MLVVVEYCSGRGFQVLAVVADAAAGLVAASAGVIASGAAIERAAAVVVASNRASGRRRHLVPPMGPAGLCGSNERRGTRLQEVSRLTSGVESP